MIDGFDVSSYQPNVNFPGAKAAGKEWCYIKSSEGLSVDPSYAGHRAASLAAGLVTGAYHFCRPGVTSPSAEADHFVSVAGFVPGMFAVVDIEAGSGNLAAYLQSFVVEVHNRIGTWPLVYSGEWFSGPHGLDNTVVTKECGLIQSGYVAAVGNLPNAPGWNRVGWQYSDKAALPGAGTSDGDYWLYDLPTLEKYCIHGGALPAPVPVPPAPTPAPPAPVANGDFVVDSGDNMTDIANQLHVSLAALEAANPQVSNPNQISIGEHLHVPGGTTVVHTGAAAPSHRYTVQNGDSLSSIGSQLHIAWQMIYNANRALIGNNPNMIHAGQILLIP